MTQIRIASVSRTHATLVGERTASLTWAELREAARQPDPELAAAYGEALADAEAALRRSLDQARTTREFDLAREWHLDIETTRRALMRAADVLRTPDGGWGETMQAVERYEEAMLRRVDDRSVAVPAIDVAMRAAAEMIGDGLLGESARVHPSRK